MSKTYMLMFSKNKFSSILLLPFFIYIFSHHALGNENRCRWCWQRIIHGLEGFYCVFLYALVNIPQGQKCWVGVFLRRNELKLILKNINQQHNICCDNKCIMGVSSWFMSLRTCLFFKTGAGKRCFLFCLHVNWMRERPGSGSGGTSKTLNPEFRISSGLGCSDFFYSAQIWLSYDAEEPHVVIF